MPASSRSFIALSWLFVLSIESAFWFSRAFNVSGKEHTPPWKLGRTNEYSIQAEFFEQSDVSLQILQTIVRQRVTCVTSMQTIDNSLDEELADHVRKRRMSSSKSALTLASPFRKKRPVVRIGSNVLTAIL